MFDFQRREEGEDGSL